MNASQSTFGFVCYFGLSSASATSLSKYSVSVSDSALRSHFGFPFEILKPTVKKSPPGMDYSTESASAISSVIALKSR